MHPILRTIARITEDCRAPYLFNTQIAATAVGCNRTRFADRWYRTRRWLIQLYKAQPGELAAEFAALIAEAEAERQMEAEAARNAPAKKAS